MEYKLEVAKTRRTILYSEQGATFLIKCPYCGKEQDGIEFINKIGEEELNPTHCLYCDSKLIKDE